MEREFIPRVHHILMREYGWIPLNEFKELPIPTLFSLLEMIKEEKEEEKREYEKSKKKWK